MEIRFAHVTEKELEDASFVIPKGKITAISGAGKKEIAALIAETLPSKGNIYYNGEKKIKKNRLNFSKAVKYLTIDFQNEFSIETIYEYYIIYIKQYKIKIDNLEEKIKNSLRIVGLEEEIINRKISEISLREKKLFQLSLALLDNPKILILEEPFLYLNQKQEIKLAVLLEKLIEKFQKTVIILTEDPNIAYQYAKELILIKNKKIIQGPPEEIYYKEDHIKKPDIVQFIQLVEKKKKIKLEHRKDIRDLIKDIYRSIY